MDFLRFTYSSSMRLYLDSPETLVPGRWEFCKAGALTVPYLHCYGSSLYDPDRAFWDEAIGELWPVGPLRPYKVKDAAVGDHVCGSREQWETGSYIADAGHDPLNEDGVTVCCDPEEVETGDADGGTAVQWFGRVVPGFGGDADGGSAVQFPTWMQLAA